MLKVMKIFLIVFSNIMCNVIDEKIFALFATRASRSLRIYFVARASQYLDTASNLAPCTYAKPN